MKNAKPGSTLTVTHTQTGGGGDVPLQAAAISALNSTTAAEQLNAAFAADRAVPNGGSLIFEGATLA